MKHLFKAALGAAVLACTLPIGSANVALAQERSWSAAQSEVWSVVAQSWEDEVARNGKWPAEYLHEDALSFSAEWPSPRRADSIVGWSRFLGENSQTYKYELFPMAITVAGDTAVVHYSYVQVSKLGEEPPKREVGYTNETLVKVDGTWKFLSLSGWSGGGD